MMGETDDQIARQSRGRSRRGPDRRAGGRRERNAPRPGRGRGGGTGQLRAISCIGVHRTSWSPTSPCGPSAREARHAEHAQTIASVPGPSSLARLRQRTFGYFTGSVTGETFDGFIQQPDVDGALVGGASLDAEKFGEIVRVAASAQS
ncbi:MAG: triose-phosphate isomerase [Chloroflexia bacterium]